MMESEQHHRDGRERIEAELQQRTQQLQFLSRAAQQMNALLEVPVILRRLVAAALELTGAEGGAAGLMVGGRMVFTEYHRDGKVLPIDYQFEAGHGVPGRVMQTLEPHVSSDAAHDPYAVPEIRKALGFCKLADVPILSPNGELLGCFEIHNGAEGRAFDSKDVEFLRALAAHAAVAIENARLLHQTDQARRALAQSTHELNRFFDLTVELLCIADTQGRFLRLNPQWETTLGYPLAELEGRQFTDFIHPDDLEKTAAAVQDLARNQVVLNFANRYRCKDGSYRWIEWRSSPVGDKIYAAARDVTERKRAEAVRQLDESRLETLLELSQMTEVSLNELAGFVLEQAVRLTQSELGYLAFANEDETVLTMHAWSAAAMSQCRVPEMRWKFIVSETGLWGEPIRQRRAVITNDYQAPDPLKKGVPPGHVEVRRHMGVPIFEGNRIVIVAGMGNKAEEYDEADVRQITLLMSGAWQIIKRQRTEQEKDKLQAQLLHAQKMESIGRLAGGVAHDFNNMLQAILGNAALGLEELPPASPVRECLEEIQRSAERSADLTRQLLAFARKQTVQPRVLNLNDTVAGMLKLLRRLIGEDIELCWLPGAGLWPTKVDPSQVDQILANLCVNARDAIAGTGRVTIETGNCTLDDSYAQTHAECTPGDYVLLAVSDTGHGMDAATRAHLFEPFFTTKDVGKGTGLGLATVFGIVKQNHGMIDVYSEPGRGTVFKIYLPRTDSKVAAPPETMGRSFRGDETVLLVEDEEQVLNLGRRILRQQGYTVLAAPSPAAALSLAAEHRGPIHLLITDVVMPGTNGKELREHLRANHPHLKCLFMSGYTADVIAHHGVLDEGVHFLEKPFTVQALIQKVRDTLESAPG